MSEREDFLARWSRRKRQAGDAAEDPTISEQRAPEQAVEQGEPLKKETAAQSEEPLFDLSTLPPIESISAGTDIRAFLAAGVPAELTRAALRRAWAADPQIRDFVGLADYAWDFNAPGAMAGFGPLKMADELRREIVGMLTRGQLADESAASSAAAATEKIAQSPQQISLAPESDENESQEASDVKQPGGLHERSDVNSGSDENAAAQYQTTEPQPPQASVPRRHGRALPKS